MEDGFNYLASNAPFNEGFDSTVESQNPHQMSSEEWKWRSVPMIPGGSQPPQVPFAQYALPLVRNRTLLDACPSSPPWSSHDISTALPKVAIPRATSVSTHSQRHRSVRACEPCRQRKTKCDGNKPACRQCLYQNVRCHYVDAKRLRDQKQLGVLTRKVQRYENFLEELEQETEGSVSRRIRKTLRMSDHLSSSKDSYGSDNDTSSVLHA